MVDGKITHNFGFMAILCNKLLHSTLHEMHRFKTKKLHLGPPDFITFLRHHIVRIENQRVT